MEIDGYIRNAANMLHPQLIPAAINDLVYSYYDPWFKCERKMFIDYPTGDPPLSYISKQDNKQYFIIYTDPYIDGQSAIYIYDCLEDKWEILTTYPQEFDPSHCGATIDQKNEILYMFHGIHAVFGKYNLNTRKWEIADSKFDKKVITTWYSTDDPSTYNASYTRRSTSLWTIDPHELHTFGLHFSSKKYLHQKYDEAQGKFIDIISKEQGKDSDLPYIVTINNKNKSLYLLIRESDILYSQTFDENTKWKKFPNKSVMPTARSVAVYGQILFAVYGQILITISAFYRNEGSIYYLVIENCKDNNNNEWIKTDIKCRFGHILIDNENYLRCIRIKKRWCNQSKIHLSWILPYHLYQKYHKFGQ